MDLNLIRIAFALFTVFTVIVGSLMNTLEKHLPVFVAQTFRYGKFAYQGKPSFLKPIDVPKRWFYHFYIFGALFSTAALLLLSSVYFLNWKPQPWLLWLLDFLGSSTRRSNINGFSALVAIVLITIQVWHRLYETRCVSVFSNARINLTHYIVGYFHYFGSVTAILCESQGFVKQENIGSVRLSDMTALNVLGIVIFLWACYHQSCSAQILANLRKDNKGKVVTYKHSVPHGDWFEFVSSPHLLAEVLMYLGLSFILVSSSTWHVIFLWVLSNQVECALLAHWWYQETFLKYPKDRKAIFPYIL